MITPKLMRTKRGRFVSRAAQCIILVIEDETTSF